MKILALDLGSKTGWATHAHGHITSGVLKFEADRFEGGGMRFLKFKQQLQKMQQAQNGLELVVFEEVRRHAGTTAAHVYGGFLACLTQWCEIEKIPYRGVPVGTIKRHATGKGNAGKEVVIAAMRKKGHPDLKDDNEADALAILYYALDTFNRAPNPPGGRPARVLIKMP
jgi:Holliday junction resolvasome RuvABC endonuclease subunit